MDSKMIYKISFKLILFIVSTGVTIVEPLAPHCQWSNSDVKISSLNPRPLVYDLTFYHCAIAKLRLGAGSESACARPLLFIFVVVK